MIVCGKQQDRLEFINGIGLALASSFDPKNKKVQEIMKSMQELADSG